MNLPETLKYLRKQKHITQEQLAGIVGVERSSIGKYETGTMPSMEILSALSDYFGVTVDYLMGKEEKKEPESNLYDKLGFMPVKKRKIPMLGEIACGQPIYINEDKGSYVLLGADIDVDFCLKAKGDSMIGARIMDGDIVFVKKCDIVDNGEIAVVQIEDEATLKRVYYYPEKGKLVLNPENPKYEPLVYIGEELNQIRILGRAVAFQSDVR